MTETNDSHEKLRKLLEGWQINYTLAIKFNRTFGERFFRRKNFHAVSG